MALSALPRVALSPNHGRVPRASRSALRIFACGVGLCRRHGVVWHGGVCKTWYSALRQCLSRRRLSTFALRRVLLNAQANAV